MTTHYACHSRPAYVAAYPVQDGYTHSTAATTRLPRMVQQPTFGQRECQFTLSALGQADTRCAGCGHRSTTKGAA